jgi:SpoIID/LytB domain protein
MTGASAARLTLSGSFVSGTGERLSEGDYSLSFEGGAIALDGPSHDGPSLDGPSQVRADSITIAPLNFEECRITVHDVTIGIDFHWQRKEAQQFQGAIRAQVDARGLTLINELPLESYLVSVISSEMSASCPVELLRAHAIVSRSWLLAQLTARSTDSATGLRPDEPREMIRWYDRESHKDFDVCADDHCQRYQGISKAFSQAAFNAARDTRGKALVWGDSVCDARYSKSCGGITEVFRAAWDDVDVPYLRSVYDGREELKEYRTPLTDEANAEAWIRSSPPAFCNTDSAELLRRILPGFDQETRDFYRWQASYSQNELREIISARLGFDTGRILSIEPVERGESGRLIRLAIKAENRNLTIGKELEIRRTLSRSHLYSSAFVVEAEDADEAGFPGRFTLTGAGWGHGVGLCQIGAAVMAEEGFAHSQILEHYFSGAILTALY